MSSGARARATLRRLLRVASRYDVERPHLKALFPSPSARGDASEMPNTTLRDLVRRTARDPTGLPVDPSRARALVQRNLDALETVMRRAEAQTAPRLRDARARVSGGSAPKRVELADLVRRAVDATLREVGAERLASITRDANAEPWLRRAGARETRRRRDVRGGWSAPATAAAAANDAPGAFFGVSPFRKGSARPNAEWYADRLDAVLEEARTETPRTDPNTVYGSIARLFREARATGCPPPVTDVARAATFLAETTSSPRVIARGDEEEISRRDDGSLADASERGVDAALRLAWTAFEMEGTYLRDGGRTDETVAFDGFDDESITRTEASKENKNGAVGAAADAVVSAAARCAAATPAGPAKRNRTVRALNLLHAHMDVCVDAPGRDAAAAAVAVAARFVADESDTSEKKKKVEAHSRAPSGSDEDAEASRSLSYDAVARAVARLESLGVGVAPRARRALLAAAEKSCGLDEAFAVLERWKRSGGSPDADAVLGLLEWAVEAGDDEKAQWLEEELAATGKGAYLASLNSPGC